MRHFEGLRHEVPAYSKAANRLGIVQDHVELDFGALYAAVRYTFKIGIWPASLEPAGALNFA